MTEQQVNEAKDSPQKSNKKRCRRFFCGIAFLLFLIIALLGGVLTNGYGQRGLIKLADRLMDSLNIGDINGSLGDGLVLNHIQYQSAGIDVDINKIRLQLDLGCLAKGYSADKVAQYLKAHGVTSALINLGGNILTIGNNQAKEGKAWQIGIQDPRNPRGNHLLTIPASNKSVVTSGIYERHLTVDGKDYHHIFDSETGFPVETDLASLTIISDKSVDGEIWTTRLFGERSASILWQVESIDGIEAILIDKEGRLACSSGLQNCIM